MKKFLIKFLYLLILPVLFVLIFDVWLRNQSSSYSVKFNGLIEKKDSVEVLILGNSHANYGVDPTAFEAYYAYNLANVAQKLYFDEHITEKALRKGLPALKFVFISIDYHSLHTQRQGKREIWSYYGNGVKFKDDTYFLANLSPLLWGYTPQVALALVKKKIKNRIRYGSTPVIDFDVEAGVDITDTVKKGFVGYSGQAPSRFDVPHYTARTKIFREPENSPRTEVIANLEKFITRLQALNIEPILFSPPTYTEYNAFLDTALIRRNQRDIAQICTKYHVPYWDYMTDHRFTKADFYDMDHLNKKGAHKFSKMLSDRLSMYSAGHEASTN